MQIDKNGIFRFPQWQKKPWLVHGFSSRLLGDMQREQNRTSLLDLLDCDARSLVTAEQVHGSVVALATDQDAGRQIAGVDGLLTGEAGLWLAIRTADCIPIFMFDHKLGAVGLLHAGWQGIAAGIVEQSIELFFSYFGSHASNLEVGLGPSIGLCCCEVGFELVDRFPSYTRKHEGRYYLDLATAIRDKLMTGGLLPERILSSGFCTGCQAKHFFSYRKEQKTDKRMLAVIGLKL